jgi:hypothetical protein
MITPQGVDVDAGVEGVVAARLLRRHVERRAQDHAGLGQARRVGLAGVGLPQRLRDAEVDDLDEVLVLAAEQEDVVGFDVAVDDALGVGGAERRGDLPGDVGDPGLGQRALAVEQLGQRLTLEELHHDEGPAVVGLAEVGDVDDVLVADRRRQPGLLLEARDHLLLARVLVEQDLDRDPLADERVGRLVDRAHAALADLAGHHVAARQGRADQIFLGLMAAHPRRRLGLGLGVLARRRRGHRHRGVGGGDHRRVARRDAGFAADDRAGA